MFWLNGMAGTGKSTIARTVAQSFKDKEQLGATFFFKRGEGGRGNARYLVSTITRQLVATYRQLAPDVLAAIENDPNISSRNLSEQFNKLLLQPLGRLRSNRPTTIMMVIDALDECDREDDMQIIRLLLTLQDYESVRLRIFLTSRPDLPIRLGFKQNNNHKDVVLHELP
jgi:type II secretory pathway predicted ATPase ExeA